MLKKMIYLLLFICACTSSAYMLAEETGDLSEECKKYNFSVCAVFNNESYHLKDWIEHHRSIGVDHFYLYNIESMDAFFFVLIPYINEGLVTLVNWPGVGSQNTGLLGTKIPAYENAVHFLANDETKWLLLVDIDEFLHCPKGNIADLLVDYDDFPAIALSSTVYDVENQMHLTDKNIKESNTNIPEKLTAKMIFKPELCSGFMWPPYQCKFTTDKAHLEADPEEMQIRLHVNRKMKPRIPKNIPALKKDANFILLPEAATLELWENEFAFENEYLDLPMYEAMPNFLIKLKIKHEKEKGLIK